MRFSDTIFPDPPNWYPPRPKGMDLRIKILLKLEILYFDLNVEKNQTIRHSSLSSSIYWGHTLETSPVLWGSKKLNCLHNDCVLWRYTDVKFLSKLHFVSSKMQLGSCDDVIMLRSTWPFTSLSECFSNSDKICVNEVYLGKKVGVYFRSLYLNRNNRCTC